MSWSFSAIGTPEKIAAKIEEESEKLSGQSKVEFDDAKSHLIALVKENFATDSSGYVKPIVNISASGSGSASGGEQRERSCAVKIERLYAHLLV